MAWFNTTKAGMSPTASTNRKWGRGQVSTANNNNQATQKGKQKISPSKIFLKASTHAVPVGFTIATLTLAIKALIAAIFDKNRADTDKNPYLAQIFTSRWLCNLVSEVPGVVFVALQILALFTMPLFAQILICPAFYFAYQWLRKTLGLDRKQAAVINLNDDDDTNKADNTSPVDKSNNIPEDTEDKNMGDNGLGNNKGRADTHNIKPSRAIGVDDDKTASDNGDNANNRGGVSIPSSGGAGLTGGGYGMPQVPYIYINNSPNVSPTIATKGNTQYGGQAA